MEKAEKVREDRLRRMAYRQGLMLHRSRARDPKDLTFGGYMLVDNKRRVVLGGGTANAGRGFGVSLDEVEAYLSGNQKTR